MTTTGLRRPSTHDIRRQLTTELRQLAAIWRGGRARLHLPRRCTVTDIQCSRCRRWASPRHYSVRFMACPPCARTIAHTARAQLRAQRAHTPAQP